MIYFIGAGPGSVDLITVRGAEILSRSDMIIYAGSLVNPELVRKYACVNCELYDSAGMTLTEIAEKLISGHNRGLIVSRLHSGDPALYGAIREQINILRAKSIPFEIVPGVSSLFAASAAVKCEYMIPEVSQTLIITRLEGRTPVPERERVKALAAHKSSMAVFLSASMIDKLCSELIAGGYDPDSPAAIVYRASWPDERVIAGTLANLPELARESGINKTALILVGEFLSDNISVNSRLYNENFSHEFRK
ncbi:MAG: precorrin-4 C(11)-methyltransferase [Synergistaceae bacterium]|nr:precorrin-4 C(11)-methyltransferase [Synergistaceae bacterium]